MIRGFIRRRIDARKARFNAFVDNLYSQGVRTLTLNTIGFVGIGPAKDVVFSLWWRRWRMTSMMVGSAAGLWWQSSLLYQTLPSPLPSSDYLPTVVPKSEDVVIRYIERLLASSPAMTFSSANNKKRDLQNGQGNAVTVALSWDALITFRGTSDALWGKLAANKNVRTLMESSTWYRHAASSSPISIDAATVKEFALFLAMKAAQNSHAFDIMIAARREWEPLVGLRTGCEDPSQEYLPPYFMETCLGLLVDSYAVGDLKGHDTSKFQRSLRKSLLSMKSTPAAFGKKKDDNAALDLSNITLPPEEELVISEPVADGVTGAPRAWIIRDPVENLTLVVFAGTYKPVSPTYLGVFKCSAQFARTWLANLRFSEAPLPEGTGVDAPGSGCHKGAVGIYNSLRKELHARIPEGDDVVTCGHSLGGALALLCAAEITGDGKRSCTALTAGAPAIFNAAAVKELRAREGRLKHIRFQVTCDFSAWVFDQYKTGIVHSFTPSRYLHFGDHVPLCIVPEDGSLFNKMASYTRYLRTLADSKFGHGIALYRYNTSNVSNQKGSGGSTIEQCIVPTHYGGIEVPLEFCSGGYRSDHPRLRNMLGF